MTDQPNQHLPAHALDNWLAAVCAALDLDPARIDTSLVLDLARDVAHGVARPAAPLSAFLVGLAAGRAGGENGDIEEAASTVTELARDWPAR